MLSMDVAKNEFAAIAASADSPAAMSFSADSLERDYLRLENTAQRAIASSIETLQNMAERAGDKEEARIRDWQSTCDAHLPQRLSAPRSTSADAIKAWLQRTDAAMERHLSDYAEPLKNLRQDYTDHEEVLYKLIRLCLNMQRQCDVIINAAEVYGKRAESQEGLDFASLNIRLKLLKKRIAKLHDALNSIHEDVNGYATLVEKACGSALDSWKAYVEEAKPRTDALVVTTIFSASGIKAAADEKDTLYRDTMAAAKEVWMAFHRANMKICFIQQDLKTALCIIRRLQSDSAKEREGERALCL